MKPQLILFLLFLSFLTTFAQLPALQISDDQRYLTTQEGVPFFWLGGTAWELIHRLNQEEVDLYLTDRVNKGFTIIQTVILAELNGLSVPNAYGHTPLINNDPTKLNKEYFKHVDYVIQKAEALGLYVGLLPTWGDKFNKRWGVGPEIFTPKNAEQFGKLLAKRYRKQSNIIWILGGDRIPEKEIHYEIIKAMAKGIRKVDTEHLMTYHPSGSKIATQFFDQNWLDFDMFQSGHSRISKDYQFVSKSRENERTRPVVNGEPRYENILDRFWEKDANYGWLDAADVRICAYWSIISGAAGYTYGCNDIWQMYDISKEPTIQARTGWKAALSLPGSTHMKYKKALFEQLSWQEMNYTPNLILNENPEDEFYMASAIGKERDFMIAYSPIGKPIKLDLTQLKSEEVKAYWFNPRSGKFKPIGTFSSIQSKEFTPWSKGWGSDFLLVVVDVNSDYIFSK